MVVSCMGLRQRIRTLRILLGITERGAAPRFIQQFLGAEAVLLGDGRDLPSDALPFEALDPPFKAHRFPFIGNTTSIVPHVHTAASVIRAGISSSVS